MGKRGRAMRPTHTCFMGVRPCEGCAADRALHEETVKRVQAGDPWRN
jgi:hypothetical protein